MTRRLVHCSPLVDMLVSPPPSLVGISIDEEPVPPIVLKALTEDLPVTVFTGGDVPIRDVVEDSRFASPGSLFVVRSGAIHDGASFVTDACDRGAVAVLATTPIDLPPGCHGLVADDPRSVGIAIAQRVHGFPSEQMHVIGITGTNGKTTTAYVIRDLLEGAGIRCGLISGVSIETGARRWPATLTTPQGIDTARIMAAQVADGCVACVMEASSHALEQGRLDGISIDGAVFTNLSGDHLDYHGTMEAYAAAKRRLFDSMGRGTAVITNLDDPHAEEIISGTQGRVVTVSRRVSGGDVTASEIVMTTQGTTWQQTAPWGESKITTPLLGVHNVTNVMEAIAAAHFAGASMEQMTSTLATVTPPPGRLEQVGRDVEDCPTVVVDFAHTDGALDAVCTTLAQIVGDDHAFHIVFGCGGDRDRDKRPRMAEVACKWGDVVRLTSDNPRTENPEAILDDVAKGVSTQCDATLFRDRDRRRSIAAAIAGAEAGDVVLIAGKGHEPVQLVGSDKIPCDDRQFAAQACHARREGWVLTPRFLLGATGGRMIGTMPLDQPTRIVTDTREDVEGALFWAIRGDHHDGHDYVEAALAGGAIGVVVDDPSRCSGEITGIVVEHTTTALGWAAGAWRSVFGGAVTAITGTSGKTTTKDLLGGVLSKIGTTTIPLRSFNNEIGVPLTILSAPADGDFLIVEIGVNAGGEMAPLAAMTQPDVVIVTSIGEGHLEGLGSVQGVACEKYRLLDALSCDGTAIVADSLCRPTHEVILVGDDAEACDRSWGSRTPRGDLQEVVFDSGLSITLALPGRHNAQNAALVAIAAEVLGVGDEAIKAGLESATPSPQRSQFHRMGSVTVIEDCYNANPHSMAAALSVLQEVETPGQRIAILGDMLELGAQGPALHRRVIASLEGAGVDAAILLGSAFDTAAAVIKSTVPCDRWPTVDDEAIAAIVATISEGDTVLIKGSRGMAMERIICALRDPKEHAAI
jgi:murE/murF fusion protein